MHVVNLDPAAEAFDYPVAIGIVAAGRAHHHCRSAAVPDARRTPHRPRGRTDVRDLISLEDAIQQLGLGPNGALIYCMEFLMENWGWLREQIDGYQDDYLLFDCPGQIELYTHVPVMRQLVEALAQLGYRVCTVYILDAQFIVDPPKFVAGSLAALAAMAQLETPHINVLSKVDLLDRSVRRQQLRRYVSVRAGGVSSRRGWRAPATMHCRPGQHPQHAGPATAGVGGCAAPPPWWHALIVTAPPR